MKSPLYLIPLLACGWTSLCAQAEDRFAKVEIQTEKLTENIYMLTGSGGNIGLSVGADGILMVDGQYAPLAPKLKRALAALGDAAPTFLLNTHFHADHTGGNSAFGTDSLIIAHEKVRHRLANAESPVEPESLPVITYTEAASIYFNGEEIRLTHTPSAHTDTDTLVHFTKSNVLHMGDHLWTNLFPFIDLGSGGSVEGAIDVVAEALALCDDDTLIIPGHGVLARPDDLRRYQQMLIQTRDLVVARIQNGDSLEEIIAAGLGDQWDGWDSFFITEERWLQTLYQSYAGMQR